MKNQATIKAEEEDLRISTRERCDKIEPDYQYLKRLTREEIRQEEERLVDLAITIAGLEEELKHLKVIHKSKADPLKADYNETVGIIKSGKKMIREEVYIIYNRESREAEYYTAEGILVNQRPLTPGESQISIFNPGRDK